MSINLQKGSKNITKHRVTEVHRSIPEVGIGDSLARDSQSKTPCRRIMSYITLRKALKTDTCYNQHVNLN